MYSSVIKNKPRYSAIYRGFVPCVCRNKKRSPHVKGSFYYGAVAGRQRPPLVHSVLPEMWEVLFCSIAIRL